MGFPQISHKIIKSVFGIVIHANLENNKSKICLQCSWDSLWLMWLVYIWLKMVLKLKIYWLNSEFWVIKFIILQLSQSFLCF